MKIIQYSHQCKPEDWNLVKVQSVVTLLKSIDLKLQHGCSSTVRKTIHNGLIKMGWSSKIKLSITSQISITAMNGDFALCLQTGNMGRFYADLLKLEYIYRKRNIMAAIYILPTKQAATTMGSNLVNYERLVDELNLFQEIVTVPIFVIGFN